MRIRDSPLAVHLSLSTSTSQYQGQHPPALRLHLQSGAAVTCPRDQVAHLGISCHVLHALAVWSSLIPDFQTQYQSLPFGSRVVVENIASNVHDMQISMVPNHELEHDLLSLKELQDIWHPLSDEGLEIAVESISLSSLKLLDRRHETISIVSIPHLHNRTTRFVFKAITPRRFTSKSPAQTYHELKLLLAMTPIRTSPLGPYTSSQRLSSSGSAASFFPTTTVDPSSRSSPSRGPHRSLIACAGPAKSPRP